jgi:hypothetical protein
MPANVVLFRQGYSEGLDPSLQGQMAGWVHFSTYWFDSKWLNGMAEI